MAQNIKDRWALCLHVNNMRRTARTKVAHEKVINVIIKNKLQIRNGSYNCYVCYCSYEGMDKYVSSSCIRCFRCIYYNGDLFRRLLCLLLCIPMHQCLLWLQSFHKYISIFIFLIFVLSWLYIHMRVFLKCFPLTKTIHIYLCTVPCIRFLVYRFA